MSTTTTIPELFMRASAVDHAGRLARWSIYSEPRGVPFSWQIRTDGGTVLGSSSTWQQARERIAAYLEGRA
jgi:hypothetical protein